MKTIVGIAGALLLVSCHLAGASAQSIAVCSDLSGYANYHHSSAIPKTRSGFQKDAITGGLTSLQLLDNGDYDILIVDSRKRVISYTRDGGFVRLLRKGSRDATFLVVFPGMVVELYTFYTDAGGQNRFDVLQSKGGDAMPIPKSAVMTGDCSELHLYLLP